MALSTQRLPNLRSLIGTKQVAFLLDSISIPVKLKKARKAKETELPALKPMQPGSRFGRDENYVRLPRFGRQTGMKSIGEVGHFGTYKNEVFEGHVHCSFLFWCPESRVGPLHGWRT